MPQRTTEVHITAATAHRPEAHTAGAAALHRPEAPAAAHSRAAHTVQAAAAAEVPAVPAAVLHTGEDNVKMNFL